MDDRLSDAACDDAWRDSPGENPGEADGGGNIGDERPGRGCSRGYRVRGNYKYDGKKSANASCQSCRNDLHRTDSQFYIFTLIIREHGITRTELHFCVNGDSSGFGSQWAIGFCLDVTLFYLTS
jgi:hypothetical protein